MSNRLKIKEELEVLAATGGDQLICFRSNLGTKISISDRIMSFFEEDGKSFIQTGQGLIINVDELVSINDKPVESFI